MNSARASTVRALGLATLPIYLLHQPIGIPLIFWMLHAGAHPLLALAAGSALVFALAFVVALHLEPALRKRLVPLIDRSAQHVPALLHPLKLPTVGVGQLSVAVLSQGAGAP